MTEIIDPLVSLIQAKGRWPSIALPLLDALNKEAWRHEGFASATAWLDRLAALGGRSTTYLSRCVSAARYVSNLAADMKMSDVSPVWQRPLTDIEAFRRYAGEDRNITKKELPALCSGAFNSHTARADKKQHSVPPGRAERQSFPDIVLTALPRLKPHLGCPSETAIIIEPRTPIFRPDAVLVYPDGRLSILEVKGSLSGRVLPRLFQQLLALSSLSNRVWLVLPSDSELPGQTLIDHLRRVAIFHVGLLLLDPSTCEIMKVFQPESDAPSSESRSAFRQLVQTSLCGDA